MARIHLGNREKRQSEGPTDCLGKVAYPQLTKYSTLISQKAYLKVHKIFEISIYIYTI